jgi:hypothetical protein
MTWQAQYYHGISLSGSPLVERSEEAISLSTEDDLPKEVKDRSPQHIPELLQVGDKKVGRPHGKGEWFSARWRKGINGPGTFRFDCATDDGMRVSVDGQRIINEWRDQGVTRASAEKQLSAGPHEVVVEYYQAGGGFKASVTITRTAGQSEEQIKAAWAKVSQTGHLTRGGLEAARLYEADDDGHPIDGMYEIMYCMFNPSSYKINKSAKFTVKGLNEKKNYNVSFDMAKVEPRILTIKELWFDTSDTFNPDTGQFDDVGKFTDRLVEFAEITAGQYVDFKNAMTAKAPPPKVAFQWGTFRFLGVIESVKVKFTLFTPDGIPIRAKVSNLKLREFRHRKAYPKQNPSSGDGPLDRIWRVQQGQRLDMIAAHVYGDAGQWRTIAEYNQLVDAMTLQPGQLLRIPASSQ